MELQSQLFKNNGSPAYFNQLKDGMVINGSNAISGMGGFGALSINYDIVSQGNKLVLSPNMMNFNGSLANNETSIIPTSMGKWDIFTGPITYQDGSWVKDVGYNVLAGLQGTANVLNNIAGTGLIDLGFGSLIAMAGYANDLALKTGLKQTEIDAIIQITSKLPVGAAIEGLMQWASAGMSVAGRTTKLSLEWFENVARNATRNPDSNKLVLGHFAEEGSSYQKVAAHYNATYFKLDDWRNITKSMSKEDIWKINESFLDQQIIQNKRILFSHNPDKAKSGTFFQREVNYLKKNNYQFRRNNKWTWEAYK